jgi:hypothetical protein
LLSFDDEFVGDVDVGDLDMLERMRSMVLLIKR